MSDRRSAIRSTDNRAEKHVAFKSPLMSVRSITPLSDMMQFDTFRSPTSTHHNQQQQHHQQNVFRSPTPLAQPLHRQSPKRPASANSPQGGTPAKRRVPADILQILPPNATLEDVIVRNCVRVQMINDKVNGFYDQIPTVFELADSTLDTTSNLVLGFHFVDKIMHGVVEQEKVMSRELNKFLRDADETDELDLTEFTEDYQDVEDELEADMALLDDMLEELEHNH